jgi:hypothetical protein
MVIEQPEPRHFRPGAIAGGAILLALGAAMLLDTTGVTDVHTGRLVPPMILIALGVLIMVDKGAVIYTRPVRDDRGEVRLRVRRRGGAGGGLWLMGIGAWMLVSQMHLFGLSYATSWPLFIILMGLMIMIRGTR